MHTCSRIRLTLTHNAIDLYAKWLLQQDGLHKQSAVKMRAYLENQELKVVSVHR